MCVHVPGRVDHEYREISCRVPLEVFIHPSPVSMLKETVSV